MTTRTRVLVIIDDVMASLANLSFEESLSPGEVTEAVEAICSEQNHWKENSSGWKVLEALKDYVRDNG